MEGTTKNGFKFEIEEKNLDNMELVEYIAEVEENPLKFPKMCELLLGKEQKKRLYDHVREENGIVPVKKVTDAVMEIFAMTSDAKNS